MRPETRKSRERALRQALSMAGAAALGGLVWWLGPDMGHKYVFGQLKKIPLGDVQEAVAVVEERYAEFPLLVACLIGAVAAWLVVGKWIPRIHARFLLPFDTELLNELGPPPPFHPPRGINTDNTAPLRWTLPASGQRYDVFQALVDFAKKGSVGRWKGTKRSPIEDVFDYTFLLGSSGTGKSRLALQVALRLALRPDSGAMTAPTRLARLSAWWRLQIRLQRARSADPWDVGLLRPELTRPNQDEKERHTAFSEELAAWRPRRATFIILDNPVLGTSALSINLLQKSAKDFLHPVRLLIVNQTVPLEAIIDTSAKGWTEVPRLHPKHEPQILSGESFFSPKEVQKFDTGKLLTIERLLTRFMRVTRGNPLLVEFGLQALLWGQETEDLSKAKLLTDRVTQIREALKQADFGSDVQLRAIATATIAGGVPGGMALSGVTGEAALKSVVTEAFPLEFDSPRELSRLWPTAGPHLRNYLPPIRPEIIGDIFAAKVLEESSDADRQKIITTAWRANPLGTLRTALRVAGADDVLGRLIDSEPTNLPGIDSTEVTLAFVRAALFLPHTVTAESDEAISIRRLLTTTCRRVATLCKADALGLVDRLLDMENTDQGATKVSWHAWAAIAATVLTASIESESPSQVAFASILVRLERFGMIYHKRIWRYTYLNTSVQHAIGQLWNTVTAAYGELADLSRLSGVSHKLNGDNGNAAWIISGLALFRLIIERHRSEQQSPAYLELLSICCERVSYVVDDKSLYQIAIRTFLQLESSLSEDIKSLEATRRAIARVRMTMAKDASTSQQAYNHAVHTESLANLYPSDRDVALLAARAWAHASLVSKWEHPTASEMASRIDGLASRYSFHADFSYTRALGWRCATYAAKNARDLTACDAFIQRVKDIAATAPEDPALECEVLEAIGFRAELGDQKAVALRRARAAEASKRFPAVISIQSTIASWLATEASRRPERQQRRENAEEVDEIGQKFSDDAVIQSYRAQTWNHFAESCDKVQAREICQKALDILDAQQGIKLNRARMEILHTLIRKGDDYDESLIHALEVERIVRSSNEDEFGPEIYLLSAIQNLQLVARRDGGRTSIIGTRRQFGGIVAEMQTETSPLNGQEITRNRLLFAANWAEEISKALANKPYGRTVEARERIDEQRSNVWLQCAIFSYEDKLACKAFVERVQSIAAAHPTSQHMQLCLIAAWRAESRSLELNIPARWHLIGQMKAHVAQLENPDNRFLQEVEMARRELEDASRSYLTKRAEFLSDRGTGLG